MDPIEELFRQQDGLATRAQLRERGLSLGVLNYRCGPRGRWVVPLPGVVAGFSGELSERQRQRAALLWGGPSALLGGATAAQLHGLRYVPVPLTKPVHLLLPHELRRESTGFVVVRRTLARPASWTRQGLPVVLPERAVVDACRQMDSLRDVRALIAESVQRGRTTVERLEGELEAGGSAGSRLIRQALADVRAGARSAPEAEFRDLARAARLPEPVWNHDLYTHNGTWVAAPDGWWKVGVAFESDSKEWHLQPESWEETLKRHERMASYGIVVVHATPRRIRTEGQELIDSISAALAVAARRRPPELLAVPRGMPFRPAA